MAAKRAVTYHRRRLGKGICSRIAVRASPCMACWIAALRVSVLHCARADIIHEQGILTSTSQMPALKVIIGRIDMAV